MPHGSGTVTWSFVALTVLLAPAAGVAVGLGRSPIAARLASGLPLRVLVGFPSDRVRVELLSTARTRKHARRSSRPTPRAERRHRDRRHGDRRRHPPGGGRLPRRLVAPVAGVWNAMGAALHLNVVGVALPPAGTPLGAFHDEPANV